MTTREQLAALAWEARRRGISYGELTVRLKPGEELTIYERFQEARAKAERERKAAQKRAAEEKKRRMGRTPKGARPLTVDPSRKKRKEGN